MLCVVHECTFKYLHISTIKPLDFLLERLGIWAWAWKDMGWGKMSGEGIWSIVGVGDTPRDHGKGNRYRYC